MLPIAIKRGETIEYILIAVILFLGLILPHLSFTGYQVAGVNVPSVFNESILEDLPAQFTRDLSTGDLTCTLPGFNQVISPEDRQYFGVTYNFFKDGESITRLLMDFEVETEMIGQTVILDNSENGNLGVVTGPVASRQSDLYKWAYTFDGTDDIIFIDYDNSLALGDDFSIEFFVSPESRPSPSPVITTLPGTFNNWRTFISQRPVPELDPNWQNGGFFLRTGTNAVPPSHANNRSGDEELEFVYFGEDDEWHAVVTSGANVMNGGLDSITVTKKHGERAKIYVDGQEISTTCEIGDCLQDYKPSTEAFFIGGDGIKLGYYGDDELQYAGDIDEVRIYRRALTSQQILAMYNARAYNFILAEETNAGEQWECQPIVTFNRILSNGQRFSAQIGSVPDTVTIPGSPGGGNNPIGGGGSSSSGTQTYTFNVDTTSSRTYTLRRGWRVKMRGIGSSTYRFELDRIRNSQDQIEFSISNTNFDDEDLIEDESKHYDLNDDGTKDVTITNENVINPTRARVTFRRYGTTSSIPGSPTSTALPTTLPTSLPTTTTPPSRPRPSSTQSQSTIEEADTTTYKAVALVLVIVIILGVIVALMMRLMKNKKQPQLMAQRATGSATTKRIRKTTGATATRRFGGSAQRTGVVRRKR